MIQKKNRSTLPLNERLKQLTENNRIWYVEYETWLKTPGHHNKPYASGTIEKYTNLIINLLEFFEDLDADKVNIENIESFFNVGKVSTGNAKVNYTKNFYTFLTEFKGIEINFLLDEFKRFIADSKTVKEDSEDGTAKELTIQQIIMIRNLLKTDSVRLFAFEMVYQYGLKLKELTQCIEANYDYESRSFKIKRGKKVDQIYVNDRIHKMIVDNPSILKSVHYSANQDRISEIGRKLHNMGVLERRIRWKDVEKTRTVNFFKCPSCGDIYENTPDNWAIIQYKTDSNGTKWIVCKVKCSKGIVR